MARRSSNTMTLARASRGRLELPAPDDVEQAAGDKLDDDDRRRQVEDEIVEA